MKISIPTRFDSTSISEYITINQKHRLTGSWIYEVYGSLSSNPFGSARASSRIPFSDLATLSKHVNLCHDNGLRFHYTLNSPCLGNIEYTPEGQKQILGFVRDLVSLGVDAITVSNIFLMDLIHAHFDIDIYASIIANINTPENAEFIASKGVKKIVLSSDIYRSLELLKQIREAVSCQLEIIANMFCFINCPLRWYHYATTGHAAQDPQRKPPEDYCSLNCSLRILENPYKILQIPMVRPEDIQRYQEIGIDSIKIAGRTARQSTLTSLAQLYMEQGFPGDIGVLIDRRTIWTRVQRRLPQGTPAFEIRIDNDALSELVNHFLNRGCLGQCHKCGMCREMANEILEYDEDLRLLYLAELKKMLAEQFNYHQLENSD